MNYKEALEFLESPSRFSPKLGLERIRVFLSELGSPQDCFPSVLIAGTSGKGSSCKMIESVLTASGYKVGLFTKPHLQSYRERVALGDELISPEDLTRLVEKMVPLAGKIGSTPLGFPTYFEMGVALAFQYFALNKVDIAIVEVGMGGRLDATNILMPIVCGITEIGFDHEKYLGSTLSQIAGEKAGIIKPGVPVVVSRQEPEAMAVITRVARELRAPIFDSDNRGDGPLSFSLEGQTFNLRGRDNLYRELFIPLLGEHQIRNAALALTVLEVLRDLGFSWNEDHLRRGFAELKWPGRLEVLSQSPLVVIDGAHNPCKAQALAQAVAEYLLFKRLILVLGVSRDKDFLGILEKFLPMNPLVIATAASSGRALSPPEIKQACQNLGIPCEDFPSVRTALKRAIEVAEAEDLILVSGSIYVAGEARDLYFQVG
ncbi:MAG: bifunctional folylpolyglutamate synthase/dihydrofolate synthase [Caldiserica bacterium]|jgi:dihydrofolate synthase/folylpolyglutamate synthase|nr:bifunctional folylpolyglutamate synthase/dihydrofolate synthase [Caldisericota bacterium]